MRKFISEILLLIVTVIWGLAFVWQNIASQELGAFAVVGIRAFIAVIFLFVIAVGIPVLYKSQEPKVKVKGKFNNKYILSLCCGIALFFAMYIQQLGVEQTTASKAGFISVLYICIVPLIGIFLGNKLNKFFIIGLIISVVGLYLLSVKGDFILEVGDLIVLASAFLFAIHIIIIDYASVRVNSMFLSIMQMLVVSVLSFIMSFLTEVTTLSAIMPVFPELLALGILSSGVAYTLQIIGQREVPPHTASLIMSLESVFAAVGGVFILSEILTIREVIGMIAMLIGLIVSQKKDKKKVETF